MEIIDTHAHLDHPRFGKDLEDVISRFKRSGGKLIITSGLNPTTNRDAKKLSEKYDCVKASFGIYPIDALLETEINESDNSQPAKKFNIDEELLWIEKHANDCIAVGEIGLDYNREDLQTKKMRERQKANFKKILRKAKAINKVVIIHSRKAELDAIEILEEEKMKRVIMHCFSGKKALIKRCVENGWSFSIPPVIARLDHFKMLVEIVPLSQLLTETDAPFLSPVAGERNEPANISTTLEIIANIKNLDKKIVADKIWDNAKKLFEFN